MCSEWGVVPPPPVHRCRWLAGAPKAQHPALPSQGQIQLQGWLLWGQFPPLVFGRTARAGPGRQRDSRAGCGAGVQGNVLAGATAVPRRAAIRGTDDQGHLPKHQVDSGVWVRNFLHLDSKGMIWTVKVYPSSYLNKYLAF